MSFKRARVEERDVVGRMGEVGGVVTVVIVVIVVIVVTATGENLHGTYCLSSSAVK